MRPLAIGLTSKVAMSNRQYAALKLFTETDEPLTIDMAINVDQRSLGSLFYRGWITYDRQQGFKLTRAGREAKERFDHTVIIRDHPSHAFSHYMKNVRVLADYRVTRNGKE